MVKIKKAKVKIEVFVPLGSCVCSFAPHMEKVGRVTSKFKEVTEVQMKSNKSSEAHKYGVQEMGIVINARASICQKTTPSPQKIWRTFGKHYKSSRKRAPFLKAE